MAARTIRRYMRRGKPQLEMQTHAECAVHKLVTSTVHATPWREGEESDRDR